MSWVGKNQQSSTWGKIICIKSFHVQFRRQKAPLWITSRSLTLPRLGVGLPQQWGYFIGPLHNLMLPVTLWLGSSLSVADSQLVSDEGRRQLRSATSRTCVVRRTYSNYGDSCFAGPKLWNSLPAELQQADITFQRFKWLLKTFLFGAEIVVHCD